MRFSGSRKGEKIIICETEYTLSVGGIISDIANLTQAFYEGIARVIDFLNAVKQGSKPIQEIKHLPKLIETVEASEVLRAILLWQPFLRVQSSAMIQQRKYEFSAAERTSFWNDENKIDELHKRLDMLKKHSAVKWNYFRGLIEGNELEYKENELNTLKECFAEYYMGFDILTSEIWRLHTHLADYLEGSDRDKIRVEKEICSIGATVSVDTEIGDRNLFKKNAQKKYSQEFVANDIYGLVALELNLRYEINRDFTKCKLCGRYFVPYSRDNVYCSNKNAQYNNRRCEEIGPNIFYKKHRAENLLKKEYDKNEKAYDKWYRDNIKVGDKETDSEMKRVYESWKAKCKQAIEAVERGEMTEEDARQIIKLPAIRDRSEKLYKIKKFGTYEK